MQTPIPIDIVLAAFLEMTGESSQEAWNQLCLASCNTVAAGLKEGIDYEANRAPLCNAAACHAFYMYVLRSCATEIASFKAVDISVENTSRLTLEAAKTILEEAMAAIAPLLKSTRFAFKAI